MYEHFIIYGQGVSHLLIVVVFMWIAKKIAEFQVRYNVDLAIEHGNNLAVSLRHLGLYMGTAIGMIGVLCGDSKEGYLVETRQLLVDGSLVTVYLLIARQLSDRFHVSEYDNNLGVERGNVAIGIVEFGLYLATGLIAYGSMTGAGGPWWSSLVYFALGQWVLLVFARVYEYLAPFSVIKEVREGNVSAGVLLASMYIAYGFILAQSIAGPFTSWVNDLQSFALSVVMGMVLVLMLQRVVDRLFLPTSTIYVEVQRDHNVAAVVMVSGIRIALMMVISFVVV